MEIGRLKRDGKNCLILGVITKVKGKTTFMERNFGGYRIKNRKRTISMHKSTCDKCPEADVIQKALEPARDPKTKSIVTFDLREAS